MDTHSVFEGLNLRAWIVVYSPRMPACSADYVRGPQGPIWAISGRAQNALDGNLEGQGQRTSRYDLI